MAKYNYQIVELCKDCLGIHEENTIARASSIDKVMAVLTELQLRVPKANFDMTVVGWKGHCEFAPAFIALKGPRWKAKANKTTSSQA